MNGIRSPYLFVPELDLWDEQDKVRVFRASNVLAATKMFNNKRSDLLWGSEDFNWYFSKIGATIKRNFIPLVVSPIVVWVKKEKSDILAKLNAGYAVLRQENMLNNIFLLNPELMEKYYKDAPFTE